MMWTHIVFLNQSDDSDAGWSPVFVGNRLSCVKVGNEIADYLGFDYNDTNRSWDRYELPLNRFPDNKAMFEPIESPEYILDRLKRNRIALLFRDVPDNVRVYRNYLDAVEEVLKMREAKR